MKKVRLSPNCLFPKMNTPYGVVTHEWRGVSDDAYVYKEMEVFGESKPEPIKEIKPEPEVKEIPQEKPEPLERFKKKRRKK